MLIEVNTTQAETKAYRVGINVIAIAVNFIPQDVLAINTAKGGGAESLRSLSSDEKLTSCRWRN